MKAIAVTLVFGLVAAQNLGALPACARDCLTDFTTGDKIGNCPRLDAKCICQSDSFISGISCCLSSACSQTDQANAIDYAVKFCGTQKVQVPSAVSCESASGTSAATPSATPNAGDLVFSTNIFGSLLAALALF
ncbi:hypothetical protein F4810DRAFT_399812 [Camillea tinctor]|nr:hypothetical protein F4810DRAFT_399812 [Camillea tinctor]